MGLLGKFLGGGAAKKPTDDILLLHAMVLMSAADGYIESAELATLEAFIDTLPEFKDADCGAQIAAAKKLSAMFKSSQEAVAALADISSDAVRKKAFVLAADIALSSGDVDEAEEELLEAMQRVLGIDDDLANKILEVLALKYAR
ncbi:MAG TPA: tellurite resistance TerB family protein [Kofleriaceae bacterium]|nr:tellurite resistance TerB family protein [Kofleriaceae bacterium]